MLVRPKGGMKAVEFKTKSLHNPQDPLHLIWMRTRGLLASENTLTEEELHQVKSLLYALLERLGMKAEEVSWARSKLLRLFAIVTSSYDLREDERSCGLRILDELEGKTCF